jgi:ABC-type transport system involved in multi-copper enzyme maturation permease subunit
MLWYKAWRETRWRFLAGLLILCALSASVVLTQPLVAHMQFDMPNLGERMNQMVREMMSVLATYRGYIWSQWFGKNLISSWALFAVLIGVGGVVTETTRGTALFTLSLPVTRARLLGVRALVGVLELVVLAFVPSLLIPLLSPLIGESYSITETLIYASLTVVGGFAFYSFASLLSSIFADQLKPIVIGVMVTFILNMLPILGQAFERFSIYTVMSGQSYFKGGGLPWVGLGVSLALSVVMFVLSLRIIERKDF